jgi:acyl-CoA synthetase (AMP-forming)/AMP-acid ligase II
LSSPGLNANVSRHLDREAVDRPEAAALKIPRGRHRDGQIDYLALSFAELAREAAAWSARLAAGGVRRGDRALVMVRPGLPLIAAIFGLFRLGAVPVVIDPGMGLKNFLACVARTRPRALVGIPLAQAIGKIFRPQFRGVECRIAVSGRLDARLDAAADRSAVFPEPVSSAPNDPAAILFTSGSTGAPKGVRYEHGMFEAQIASIRETYGIAPGEVDLPLLPVFALFNPALGMTTIVPEIDPRRPAAVDPAKIVQAIRQEGVTNSFGSPTLWRIIGAYCNERRITLPTLRRVLCAGAPVPADLWNSARAFLSHGRLESPYGATEALPVSSIGGDEALAALAETAGAQGAPVGRPLRGVEVRIAAVVDGSIPNLAQARLLPAGEVGEVLVGGAFVTREYDSLPEATAAAKVRDGERVLHRMGDCGCLDAQGRLWFCGRRAERVVTPEGPLDTEPVERIFRAHPRAARCALVGLGPRGAQTPALAVEAGVRGKTARLLADELRALALSHPHTASIKLFFFHPRFPLDVRHQAKIHRLTLARWAAEGRMRKVTCDG